VDGDYYIKFPNFEKYQSLRKDRSYKSDYPDPLSDFDTTRHDTSGHDGQNLREVKGSEGEGKGSEGEVKEEKLSFSEFKNVFLTQAEYQKLQNRYGNIKTESYIEKLGGWMRGDGKTKKDHYATIINWIIRDEKPEKKDVFEEARKILEAENGNK